ESSTRNWPLSVSAVDALQGNSYNEYDVLDFGRTSLKRRQKGRRVPNFEQSDSELELKLEQAWENDRAKKKARKQQRAELRSLLGRTESQPDLEAKSPGGMTMDDLKSEIKAFLLSPSDRYDTNGQ